MGSQSPSTGATPRGFQSLQEWGFPFLPLPHPWKRLGPPWKRRGAPWDSGTGSAFLFQDPMESRLGRGAGKIPDRMEHSHHGIFGKRRVLLPAQRLGAIPEREFHPVGKRGSGSLRETPREANVCLFRRNPLRNPAAKSLRLRGDSAEPEERNYPRLHGTGAVLPPAFPIIPPSSALPGAGASSRHPLPAKSRERRDRRRSRLFPKNFPSCSRCRFRRNPRWRPEKKGRRFQGAAAQRPDPSAFPGTER